MNELIVFSLIYVASVFISSVSQIILKKSAGKKYENRIREYLNPLVITAYALFFGCTLITMYALKVVPLSMSPIIESTGLIFITVLSAVFLKEKLKPKQVIGMVVILAGIIIFSLQF